MGRKRDGTWSAGAATTPTRPCVSRSPIAYGLDRTVKVRPKTVRTIRIPLAATRGWYDVSVTVAGHPHVVRALAGRFENGRDGTSDPQLGR